MKIYRSSSSEETKKLGERIAREVLGKRAKNVKKKGAIALALKGNLGAGKTTFVQGFFKGLGLKKRAPSPTFIIMRRHSLPRWLKKRKLTNIFHVDAYRLKNAKHLATLGLKETLADAKNIVLVEWPAVAKRILPKGTTWIVFKHGKHENERHIMIKR